MESTYSDSAVQRLLFDPIQEGANRLCIMTSHATPNMASWLLKSYEEHGASHVSVEMIVGDTLTNGIDSFTHEAYKLLQGNRSSGNYGKFTCCYLYLPPELQRNTYIWLNFDSPQKAFTCSHDFTQAALLRRQSASVSERSAVNSYRQYEATTNRAIFCTHAEVEEYVTITSSHAQALFSNVASQTESVVLPLITKKTGEPGKRSGLNWGQRGKRNRNQAYIPLPSKIAKSGFFPLNEQHFLVITDDHHTLQLRVEQQNDKAITTPASNAQLGEYFRNRLNLANGAFVTASDLRTYGRTDVTFYKIDDEQYYMDFSVPARSE
ncbi:MAG: NgoFVII family restriction endonuclease [Clostridia bacterium]|nr:NgoFVII family restriction endonuclease [Clostridia bacterium]